MADRLTDCPEADGRLIVDRTGLTGRFDWSLRWAPNSISPETAAPDALPSLFTALREQFGLRLAPQEATVDAVAVLHAERPSPN